MLNKYLYKRTETVADNVARVFHDRESTAVDHHNITAHLSDLLRVHHNKKNMLFFVGVNPHTLPHRGTAMQLFVDIFPDLIGTGGMKLCATDFENNKDAMIARVKALCDKHPLYE